MNKNSPLLYAYHERTIKHANKNKTLKPNSQNSKLKYKRDNMRIMVIETRRTPKATIEQCKSMFISLSNI
jgi:hypothetical protein